MLSSPNCSCSEHGQFIWAHREVFPSKQVPIQRPRLLLRYKQVTIETFITGEIKNRIKNSCLIDSKASAEPFLQTHQFPSLPLLPSANSIISFTTCPYKHPVSLFFASFSRSFMSFLLLISPTVNALPSLCLLFLFSLQL